MQASTTERPAVPPAAKWLGADHRQVLLVQPRAEEGLQIGHEIEQQN